MKIECCFGNTLRGTIEKNEGKRRERERDATDELTHREPVNKSTTVDGGQNFIDNLNQF